MEVRYIHIAWIVGGFWHEMSFVLSYIESTVIEWEFVGLGLIVVHAVWNCCM